jgi:hypothetical protein
MRRLMIPAAALLLASCALGPVAQLAVLLPPLPDGWRATFPRIDCLLSYGDGSGEMQWEHVEGWESGHVIACTKAGNSPVLAYPIVWADRDPRQPGALRPAGGVYPESAREYQHVPSIDLTWQDGAVARVAQEIGRAGLEPGLFNIERLREEIGRRQDPWDLDLLSVVQCITSGRFDVYDIDLLPLRDIRVDAGEGRWVTESPFRNAAESDAAGVLRLADVSVGLHTVFSSDGKIVKVDVRGNEVISSPAPPAGGAGTGQAGLPQRP